MFLDTILTGLSVRVGFSNPTPKIFSADCTSAGAHAPLHFLIPLIRLNLLRVSVSQTPSPGLQTSLSNRVFVNLIWAQDLAVKKAGGARK